MGVKFSNSNPAAPGGMTLATIQKDPVTGEVSVAVSPSASSGGVNAQTTNYLILTGDAGKIVSMNGSNLTATLPASAPSSTWAVFIENVNATPLTIVRNGHLIDGAASDLTLSQNQGVYISTDGTNWFTERGIGNPGTVTTTGSPVSGNLTKFSGTSSITNGDLSGDVTTAGTLTTTLANIPNDTPMAGDLLATNISAPATPSAGKDRIYVDSTDKRLHDKNDAGTIGTTVVADTGATHNFLTAISAAGVISKAQPAVSDLTGFVAVNLTAQSASIGSTNLQASAAAGLYRISYYLNITQAATTSSSITLTFTWTDGSTTSQTFTTPAIVKNTVGYFISDIIAIESGATQNIAYSTTYASVGGTSMQYSLRIRLEAM